MKREEIIRRTRGIALTSITPFKADGSIDDKGIHQLVEFLVERGISGDNGFLVPLSTTGNFLSLSFEERKQVIDVYLKAVSDRIPVVVGCNHIRLSDSIDLARYSQDRGAVGIMVSPPFYWKATEAQIIHHYHQICSAVDIGVVIYNNHWASQVDLSVQILERILENENVIGLKESTHSVTKLIEVARKFENRINILNGLGEAYEPTYMQLGCSGFTSTLGNVIPELSVRLHSFLKDQNTEKAKELANHLTPLALFMDSLTGGQYIAALKHMLNRFGVCERTVRPPVIPLKGSEIEQLEQLSKNLKAAVESSNKRI